jgi:hypothetical protein
MALISAPVALPDCIGEKKDVYIYTRANNGGLIARAFSGSILTWGNSLLAEKNNN